MALETVQKPTKMSFNIEELAKSSRHNTTYHTDAVVYNLSQNLAGNFNAENGTPLKLQSLDQPMTSTPVMKQCSQIQSERKRKIDSLYSEESSNDSKSSSSYNSSSDDLMDEQPRKKSRCAFTQFQVSELEKYFSTRKFLPIEERPALAKRLNLNQQQVKTWFQNRRMKEKRQQKQTKKKNLFQQDVIDFSVAMGMQYSHIPITMFQQHYPESPASQFFDQMSYMCGYGPASPMIYSGYSQPMYNGLSPQPSQQYRV